MFFPCKSCIEGSPELYSIEPLMLMQHSIPRYINQGYLSLSYLALRHSCTQLLSSISPVLRSSSSTLYQTVGSFLSDCIQCRDSSIRILSGSEIPSLLLGKLSEYDEVAR